MVRFFLGFPAYLTITTILQCAQLIEFQGRTKITTNNSNLFRRQQFRQNIDTRFDSTSRGPSDPGPLRQVLFTRGPSGLVHQPELTRARVRISILHFSQQPRPAFAAFAAADLDEDAAGAESGTSGGQPGPVLGLGIFSIRKHGLARFRFPVRDLFSRTAAATILDELEPSCQAG